MLRLSERDFAALWNASATVDDVAVYIGVARDACIKRARNMRERGWEMKGLVANRSFSAKRRPKIAPPEPFWSPGSMESIVRGCTCCPDRPTISSTCPIHGRWLQEYGGMLR